MNTIKTSIHLLLTASITHLLSTYDAPVPPPKVPIEPLLIKKLPLTELKRTVLRTMQNDFKKLVELSRIFHMDVKELSSLDSMYKEMLRVLHENKSRQERREIRCSSVVSSKSCKGSTFLNINVRYSQSHCIEFISLRINDFLLIFFFLNRCLTTKSIM